MGPFVKLTLNRLYAIFIQPRGTNADSRRREFILNTILAGLFTIASVAFLYTLFNMFVEHRNQGLSGVLQMLIFWLITLGLIGIARYGNAALAAVLFFVFILLSGVQFALAWSVGLAITELIFALAIVIAGVLFRAKVALMATGLVAAAVIILTILQVSGLQHPSLYWQQQGIVGPDSVGYLAIFAAIGLVSWLSNSEIDRSLKRARRSETALQKERDNLEITIADRTRQLEDLQLARLLEMQRFAEFGRIGANLVHEITNPLMAATLHLEAMSAADRAEVALVRRNLHQLERYLLAARKQLKRESKLRTFAVGAELRQAVSLVTNRAHQQDIKLVVDKVTNIRLYGDPVKFSQLVTNLLSNAIDATAGRKQIGHVVSLQVHVEKEFVVLTVADQGVGISATSMEHLFDPFYSTKQSLHSGLGIGLTMVKQYVEHDFRGSILVESVPKKGTTFTVKLRSQERT